MREVDIPRGRKTGKQANGFSTYVLDSGQSLCSRILYCINTVNATLLLGCSDRREQLTKIIHISELNIDSYHLSIINIRLSYSPKVTENVAFLVCFRKSMKMASPNIGNILSI
jgi:hypothetical protein